MATTIGPSRGLDLLVTACRAIGRRSVPGLSSGVDDGKGLAASGRAEAGKRGMA
jgi:hypothetical protein